MFLSTAAVQHFKGYNPERQCRGIGHDILYDTGAITSYQGTGIYFEVLIWAVNIYLVPGTPE